MGEKLVVGPIDHGFKNNRTAFNIDDDSFPTLINAYQWRGRIKRKRGTSPLGRLSRYFNSLSTAYTSTSTITLDVSGNGNLLTGFGLESGGSIAAASGIYAAVITYSVGPVNYTDNGDGTLTPSGTINYATGAFSIPAQAGHAVSATFIYYPGLVVLGLEDVIIEQNQFPKSLAFDTTYSYNISTTAPYSIYDVSFYKNPPSSGGYTAKSTVTPTSWNGQDYRQFWTVNYQGALWATNGINVPFSQPTSNICMQYIGPTTTPVSLTAATWVSATVMTFTATGNNLVVGDFVFANEFTGGSTSGLNLQTGYVTASGDTFTVKFPNATIANATYTPGIIQYLTNRAYPTKDCLRWYDGDPTNGNAVTPMLNHSFGWVNFAPPISQGSYVVAELPAAQYYLVGARMIVPFKDRLLFFGPVIQSSGQASQVYLRDTVIYSQNGTPYYTASYTNNPTATVDSPTSASINFFPILVPVNQTATSPAYFEDQPGFGGFISAGIDQSINSVQDNRDVLILGFDRMQSKLVFSGNDIVPFVFYTINAEYGTGNPFASISMDEGVLSKGSRGYIQTNETQCARIDMDIPQQVFEVDLNQNGTERACAQRDFLREWIYFSYQNNQDPDPENQDLYKFNNQTLQFNYRDNSWAVFNESYSTYGLYRKVSGLTWATVGVGPNAIATSWEVWNQPWNSSLSTSLNPLVIAGNQQGFVVVRDITTGEANSLCITAFSGNSLTVYNHCLNPGDFIVISGCIGTITVEIDDVQVTINGQIFQVGIVDKDTITIDNSNVIGSYSGGGLIQRMYKPYVQTKQFPTAWGMGRKTRIGAQQYLLTGTPNGQITLLIFLSQNSSFAYNDSPVVPDEDCINNSLIYSTVLYTCPESTNLGLTPANINLQTPTAAAQAQIWHRMNTSLLGDTVQLGFTLSDAQMRDPNFNNQFTEIELHSFVIDITPSQWLA